MRYPVTPDGRYFVVRGRLWRMSDPALDEAARAQGIAMLMRARRDMRLALHSGDAGALRDARSRVHAAKVALGERGPPWWDGDAPDYGRKMVHNTPYAEWFASLGNELFDAAASVRPRVRRD